MHRCGRRSGASAAQAIRTIVENTDACLVRRTRNGGKGAAVFDGLREARRLGFTHAVQVDADGQHDLDALVALLDAARANPAALVLGAPRFDETAPRARLRAREICKFWVDVETGRGIIEDPMCGFRVYPVDAALAAGVRGRRMEFDPEIAVRLVWAGVPVANVPVQVRYAANGESHFRPVEDNLRISWMHTRLMTRLVLGRLLRWAR
ncbi:MAG: glycosyltransferase [Polyangiales bacterium]